ncbi:enolase C-terminal domain-like protein [Actinoplanes sp. NEAU-A12]|uniref:L-fuconate dehydratase n=1 Tax=Actinoplanes sandaracinus TaxID=3045177 RepID=A0ABT6WX01_9ACTN|nr:enolase C-terminal domain-like protein [Actinoplanes sandaracinus]MDI6104265.1 enolase C-terminal domain-like protein [Actinoplanes sandaracinus]
MPASVSGSARITTMDVLDVRFPTSDHLDGSDAMNPEPDYSAAYVRLRTDAGDGHEGHALAFTTGRGNEVQANAIAALTSHVVGRSVAEVCGDLGGFARSLTHDPQLRWLGPEKGAVHMAAGAVVNAVWDLAAKRAGKPVWRFLGEMSPEEIVAQIDFRWLSDALTPDDALDILRRSLPGRQERITLLLEHGYPAYTTTPGWLGYSDEKLARLSREAVAAGFGQIKLKVGADIEDDIRRMKTARQAVGDDIRIAVDANQRWDVQPAIDWMRRLAPYDPYWIEEPTSPDDILGHAAVRRALRPIKVATGEHIPNRVVFKQLLQAGAVDIVQIDAARVGGINENVAILLLAAKFGVPVCPHAGGVGLCEMVQHLSMFDFVAVSATTRDRVIEYVDHLHEHFADPVRVVGGRYAAPTAPGLSAQMLPASLAKYAYPGGPVWAARV